MLSPGRTGADRKVDVGGKGDSTLAALATGGNST
jgi:hypothetical protein